MSVMSVEAHTRPGGLNKGIEGRGFQERIVRKRGLGMPNAASVAGHHSGRCLVATFTGEMDHVTAPAFRRDLLNLLDSGERRIVLDLGDVPVCDSAGPNAILTARRRAVELGATLVLACVRDQLRQLGG